MSLFVHDKEENLYSAKINGVELVCKEIKPEFEKTAPALAEAYHEKLPQIVSFCLCVMSPPVLPRRGRRAFP